MKAEGLQFFTDIHWPLVGLVLFFGLFICLTWMQIWRINKKEIDMLSQLPMEKD